MGLKILLVEDEELNREVAIKAIGELEHSCAVVTSGEGAYLGHWMRFL